MNGIYTIRFAGRGINRRGRVRRRPRNIVTSQGRAAILDFLCNGQPRGISFIVLGDGTTPPTITDQSLASERFRAQVVLCNDSANSISLETFVTASDSAFHIREIGTVIGGSLIPLSGILFSRALVNLDNTSGTRNLTIRYDLEIT